MPFVSILRTSIIDFMIQHVALNVKKKMYNFVMQNVKYYIL